MEPAIMTGRSLSEAWIITETEFHDRRLAWLCRDGHWRRGGACDFGGYLAPDNGPFLYRVHHFVGLMGCERGHAGGATPGDPECRHDPDQCVRHLSLADPQETGGMTFRHS